MGEHYPSHISFPHANEPLQAHLPLLDPLWGSQCCLYLQAGEAPQELDLGGGNCGQLGQLPGFVRKFA